MKAELSRRGLLALGTAALSVGRASGAGNTLVYGMNTNPGTLRPFEQGGLAGTAIKMMTQRTLTTYTPDGKIVPCLAASWSQPTPTQFVFHLRPDAKFHNGDAVTADDVLYGFNENSEAAVHRLHEARLSGDRQRQGARPDDSPVQPEKPFGDLFGSGVSTQRAGRVRQVRRSRPAGADRRRALSDHVAGAWIQYLHGALPAVF